MKLTYVYIIETNYSIRNSTLGPKAEDLPINFASKKFRFEIRKCSHSFISMNSSNLKLCCKCFLEMTYTRSICFCIYILISVFVPRAFRWMD